jgi:hypothetical protein
MLENHRLVCALAVALGCAAVSPAHAHFTLLKPDSWLNEDGLGGPQKGGPCGPGGYDDVKPVPTSGKDTTFHAGETITVQWMTTIPHPGYMRIALAANRADFKDPPLDDATQCSFNLASVPKAPHDNVLVDGIDPTKTMQQVTLPNTPCDKCTLQVIDVMQDHGGGSCFYYHCADIKILPAGATGTGGTGGGGTGGVGTGGVGTGGVGTGGVGTGGVGTGGVGTGGVGTGDAGTGGVGTGGVGTGGLGGRGASGAGGVGAGTGVGGGVAVTPPGSGGTLGGAPGTTGTGGIAAGTGSTPSKSKGCGVARPHGAASGLAVWIALGFGLSAIYSRRRAGT